MIFSRKHPSKIIGDVVFEECEYGLKGEIHMDEMSKEDTKEMMNIIFGTIQHEKREREKMNKMPDGAMQMAELKDAVNFYLVYSKYMSKDDKRVFKNAIIAYCMPMHDSDTEFLVYQNFKNAWELMVTRYGSI